MTANRPTCECPQCGRLHWKLADKPPQAIAGPSLLKPAVTLPPSDWEAARRAAQFTGFKNGIAAAIEYHEEAADEIRGQAQLEPSSYDAIAFHEEAIAALDQIVPGGKDIEKRLTKAIELLHRVAGEIGFATDEAICKRINEFLREGR